MLLVYDSNDLKFPTGGTSTLVQCGWNISPFTAALTNFQVSISSTEPTIYGKVLGKMEFVGPRTGPMRVTCEYEENTLLLSGNINLIAIIEG